MRTLLAVLALVAAGVATGPAVATTLADQVRFSARQREIIAAFAREHGTQQVVVEEKYDGGHKDKGKDKHKALPPGIAKNYARGKPLPPGIAKKHLPAPLVKQLPPAPKGHEIVVVDGRVLLVEIATQTVRDRIEDILLR